MVMTSVRRHHGDSGMSLVELLVATSLFGLIMALLTSAVVFMMKDERRQQGGTDTLTANRKIVQLFDKQVRYANAVMTPGTDAAGNAYVVFRQGNQSGVNLQQTCYEWKLVNGTLEQRTWLPTIGSPGAYTALSSWGAISSGVAAQPSTPLFTLTTTNGATTPASPSPSPVPSREWLELRFTVTKGQPPVTSSSQITVEAINTTPNTTAPTVCNEVTP
jgi:prepilin-type N-terminal cleavage/methylation domain-containing protein